MKLNILHKPNILYNSQAVFKILVVVMSVFPLLLYGVRSVCTILLLVLGIFISILEKQNGRETNKLQLKYLGILLLPFLVIILSLLNSNNLSEGMNKIIQMLSLMAFPVIFFLTRNTFDKLFIKKVFFVFTLSVVILVLYQLWLCIVNYDYLTANLSETELKLNNIKESLTVLDTDIIGKIKTRRLRRLLLDETDTHSTYLGMWIVFAIFCLFKAYSTIKKKILISILLLVTIILLLVWLFIIASRISLIALIITASITSLFYLKKKLSFKKIIFTTSLAVLLSVSCYKFIPSFNSRVNEVLQFGLNLPSNGMDIYNFNSTNVRYGIYHCSINVISDNLLFGVGIGDAQKALNNCFNNKTGSKIYTWADYNTHNQFLFFTLIAGLLGLLFYVITLFCQIKTAIKNTNYLYLCFLIVIVCFSLTENILVRSDGVIFYAFFSALFTFNSKNAIYDCN